MQSPAVSLRGCKAILLCHVHCSAALVLDGVEMIFLQSDSQFFCVDKKDFHYLSEIFFLCICYDAVQGTVPQFWAQIYIVKVG